MGFPFFPSKSHKKRESSISKKDRKKHSKLSSPPEHTVSFGSASTSSTASSSYSLDSPTTVLRSPIADLTRISRADLESALRRFGALEGDEIDNALDEADRDGDGWIAVDDLLRGAAQAVAFSEAEGQEGVDDGGLKEAFGVYDLNGDGLISAEELLRVLAVIGDGECSIDDCRRMIGVVDSDGDGYVGFDDFAKMMTANSGAWLASSGAILSQ